MRQRSSQHFDNFLHSVAAAVAVGVAGYLSEDASGGFFPCIAGVVAFSMAFCFWQLAPGCTLAIRNSLQSWAATSRQLILLLGIVGLCVAVAVTDSRWRWDAPRLYHWIEITGFMLITASVLGQWLYVRELAPTRVALFACLGAAGVGAQSGGLLLTFIALAGCFALLVAIPARVLAGTKVIQLQGPGHQALNEEDSARHRWLIAGLSFSAVPLADVAERLQASGYFPVLLRLP